jgi:hypothetical protein
MYNGNGNGTRYGNGTTRPGIPQLYVYLGIGVLVLLGIWLVSSFLKPGIDGYFALVAGILLVLGNLRDLLMNPYPQRSNVALINTLIGGALVFFWLGKGGFPPLGLIWYVPAVVMLLVATPLMIGRASVYTAYVNTARSLVDGARRVVESVLPRTRV